ncbi:MAG: hypothetical protein NG747_03310 [Candidatus Brocadia sp.]|nr:hypothetical protein [Candidatus Brocadia sp.]
MYSWRILHLIGEDGKAKEDFGYVKNFVNKPKQVFRLYEYKRLFFWQAASQVKQGEINDAVNSLKKALEIDPKLESDLRDYAKKFEEFKILKEYLTVR